MQSLSPLAALLVAAAAGLALWFRPFAALREQALRAPWFAVLVILPFAWSTLRVPGGPPLQLSGACLLVLMFGWPLAVWTLLPIAAIGAWLLGVADKRSSSPRGTAWCRRRSRSGHRSRSAAGCRRISSSTSSAAASLARRSP
jgi:hypothetical protein